MKYGLLDYAKSGRGNHPDQVWMEVLLRAYWMRCCERAHAMSQREYDCWRLIYNHLWQERCSFQIDREINQGRIYLVACLFSREVFPVLTPLAVDPTHPFPLILNKSLNLFVSLRNLRRKKRIHCGPLCRCPRILPRLVKIEKENSKEDVFVFLSEVVRYFVSDLFHGHEVLGAWAFRITRNSHLYVDEEEVENLLLSIEEELHNQRRGAAVRLEIDEQVDPEVLANLLKSIQLSEADVVKINGPINLYRLMSLPDFG